jgi:hypothetical protein
VFESTARKKLSEPTSRQQSPLIYVYLFAFIRSLSRRRLGGGGSIHGSPFFFSLRLCVLA